MKKKVSSENPVLCVWGVWGVVGAGGGRKRGGGQDTTVLSFLSFLNPEIPKGIFSGDKYKFWSHSSGV